jgi:capsular polysaccharide export protein
MRVVLFLQGHSSFFARDLANEIERLGHRALRINLCAGDALYWIGRPSVSYRGRLSAWPQYLAAFIAREGVTDIVYFADRLPYHRAALQVARAAGIRAATFEFGYLRPDWITLERSGMSAQSHFPDDPATIRRIAAEVSAPDLEESYRYGFLAEAVNEVAFNLVTYFAWPLFPRYDADKYYHPLVDYLSYIPRLLASRSHGKQAVALTHKMIADRTPYFLAPLQMQSDYQLRANSPYRHQRDMIAEVVGSFAAHAAAGAHLVFKIHPLDNGLERWPRVVADIAARHGVAERVHVIDGGNLALMIRHAKGTVLINSTVGLYALRLGCPVKVLGFAVYDIDGLCHRGPLDAFWRTPARPDKELTAAFVRALAGTIQVKGNFFTREGRRMAIPALAQRLVGDTVNAPGAFVDPPPRLARARAMGVPNLDG